MTLGPPPDEGGILDPHGAMEHLSAWKGRIDQLAAATRAMSDRLQKMRVTSIADNGLAEVTIDHTGALVGLRLDQRIQRVAPETVAETIMNTVHKARRKAADQTRVILADTMGTDSPATQALAARIDQQLRNVEQEETDVNRNPYQW